MTESISRKEFVVGIAALGAAASLLPGCSTGSKAASGETLPKGVYESESLGAGGHVKVRLTFKENAITDVVITPSAETEIGQAAAPILQKAVLVAQSPAVDTVAGATLTSNAVREAVANCIAQSKGTAEKPAHDDLVSPVEAIKPPKSWDHEVDVAIVGASCAGLVAGARLAGAGKKVLLIEKENDVGGNARISSCIQVYGGVAGLHDKDADVGAFGTPYHDADVVDYFMQRSRWTADYSLLMNTAVSLREVSQWWVDNKANFLTTYDGGWWIYWNNFTDSKHPGNTLVSATRNLLNFERDIAEKNGAQILFQTTAKQLVMDNGKCVGVSAIDSKGKTIYIRGTEAVVLAADGMQRNHGMLAKYEGLAGLAQAGMAKGTGYVIRMGQGAGADMSGEGSFGTNDYHPVQVLHDRDAEYLPVSPSVNDKFLAILRMPWFRIDKDCERLALPTNARIKKVTHYLGDISEPVHYSAAQELSRGGSYVIVDSGWKTKFAAFGEGFSLATGDVLDTGGHFNGSAEDPSKDPYYIPPEWGGGLDAEASLAENIKKGIVKKADTIEELAKQLGLDPAKLTSAVKDWNDAVAKGQDDSNYGYNIKFMRSLDTPPYYGAYCCPALYGTYAGLRVTPKMEVVNTDGDVIPGLYASFMTAGGLAGKYQTAQCCMGDQIGSAHASGWNVSKAILGEDYVRV